MGVCIGFDGKSGRFCPGLALFLSLRQPYEQRQKDIHPSSTQQFTEGHYFLDGTKFETLFSSANTDDSTGVS